MRDNLEQFKPRRQKRNKSEYDDVWVCLKIKTYSATAGAIAFKINRLQNFIAAK